jgi:Skp family chaperone for outer membrane proteins
MRSCHFVLLTSLFWLLNVGQINAQQSTSPPPVGPPATSANLTFQDTRIAVIYTDLLYDPTTGITRLVSAMRNLNQEFEPRKIELRRLQQRIEQVSSEVNRIEPGSAASPLQTKLDELGQLKKEVQRKGEDMQTAYNLRLRDVLDPILQDLDRAIKTFAQQRGIAAVFDGSKEEIGLLYVGEGLDLTRAFIMEFNRMHPSPALPSSPR